MTRVILDVVCPQETYSPTPRPSGAFDQSLTNPPTTVIYPSDGFNPAVCVTAPTQRNSRSLCVRAGRCSVDDDSYKVDLPARARSTERQPAVVCRQREPRMSRFDIQRKKQHLQAKQQELMWKARAIELEDQQLVPQQPYVQICPPQTRVPCVSHPYISGSYSPASSMPLSYTPEAQFIRQQAESWPFNQPLPSYCQSTNHQITSESLDCRKYTTSEHKSKLPCYDDTSDKNSTSVSSSKVSQDIITPLPFKIIN